MKKFLYMVLTAAALLCSCQEYDDSEIQGRLDSIEQKLTKLESKVNDQATALAKIVGAQSIASVEKVAGGFKITFSDNTSYVLTSGADGANGTDGRNGENGKDGSNGETPVIGVKTVEGVVYWTINGELATDDKGNYVPCLGEPSTVPQFKLDNEHWYVSYDQGANWIMIDTGENTLTVQFEDTDAAYVFIVDGERYEISKSTGFRLKLDVNEIRISSTDIIDIPYTLSGEDETVHIVCTSDHYAAEADTENHVIKVTAPGSLDPDELIVKAVRNSDGAYTAQLVKITGYGEIELVADYFEVPAEENELEVPINTTLNFEVSFDVDWLTYIETRAGAEKKIAVKVAANTKFVSRTGTMTIKSVAGDVLTVIIKQAMYDDGVTMGVNGRPYELASYSDLVDILRTKRISHCDYPVEFVLTQDIDMSGEEWNPLDTSAEFPIHFDGQGHTISNFSQLSAHDAAGFFGFLVGTVENVTFDGCSVFADGQKGGIVASSAGIAGWGHTNYAGLMDHPAILKNVHVKNSQITHVTGSNWLGWTGQCGALVGEAYVPGTLISHCSAEDVEVGGTFCCGGLVGQVNYGAVVEECYVKNAVVSVSAIVPTSGGDNSSWYNHHWVDPYKLNTDNLALGYAGGITGILNEGTIRNCYICGDGSEINGGDADRQCAGGIAGCMVINSTVENCWNGAYVEAIADSPEDNTAHRAGGIVGGTSPWVSGGNTLQNCINWGDIQGAAGGGICGYISIPTDDYDPTYYGLNYTRENYVLTVGFGFGSGSFGDPETRVGLVQGTDPHDAGTCFFFHGVRTGDFIGAANALGWDSSVWDLSGSQPKLKWED